MPRSIKTLDISSFNVLVYGKAGTGKSYAPVTFPGKILLLQTEPGVCSAMEDKDFRRRATVCRLDEWEDLKELRFGLDPWITWWNRLAKKDDAMDEIEENNFDLLVLDSITWVTQICLEYGLSKYPPSNKYGTPEIAHYMMARERVRQIMSGILPEPIPTYITAQAEVKDLGEPVGTISMFLPSAVGKDRMALAYNVDYVFWSMTKSKKGGDKGEREFVLETQDTGIHLGKTRGIHIPRTIPFDLGEVFTTLKEAAAKVEDENKQDQEDEK